MSVDGSTPVDYEKIFGLEQGFSCPLHFAVRQIFNYRVEIHGTAPNGQPYVYNKVIQAYQESEAINKALLELPDVLGMQSAQMAKATRL